MKTLRRIAVVGLSVVLLLGLARKIHADGAAEISAKIAPASEIDSGAFMAQMGLFNTNQRNASFNRDSGASLKLAQLRIVPSNNLATYREFLEKPASLKLRPNPLYLRTWAPVSSANGRNSAIGSRAETITNGLTNQETLIKKAAAHGDSRRGALFGEWTLRMNLQTVDGSGTTSGGGAVIGGGEGAGSAGGGSGGGGRNDNSGGEGYAAFAGQLEAKGNADTRRDSANHSKHSVKLISATRGMMFLRTLQFDIVEAALKRITSISVDLLSNKVSGTVRQRNASGGLDRQPSVALSNDEAAEKAKAEIAGWQAYWANPSNGNDAEVRTHPDPLKTTLQGTVARKLLDKGSKSEHWGFVLQTPEGQEFILRRLEANAFEEDPIIKAYEGQDVVVRGQTDGEYFYVSVIGPLVFRNLPPQGPQIADKAESFSDPSQVTQQDLDGLISALNHIPGIETAQAALFSDSIYVTVTGNNAVAEAVNYIKSELKWKELYGDGETGKLFVQLPWPKRGIPPIIRGGQPTFPASNASKISVNKDIAAPVLPTLQFKNVSPRDEQRLRDAFASYNAQIKLAQFFKNQFGLESGNLVLSVSNVQALSPGVATVVRQYKYSAQVYSKLPPYASTTFPTAEEGILVGTLDAVIDARNGQLLSLERTGKTNTTRSPSVSPETKAKILEIFRVLQAKGFPGIQWQSEAPAPEGGFLEISLKKNFIPDGYQFDALVPIPHPDQAGYFIIVKSGGLSGKSEYSNPIKLN